jgi:hypothetical protein
MNKRLVPILFVILALVLVSCNLRASKAPTIEPAPFATLVLPNEGVTVTVVPTFALLPSMAPKVEPTEPAVPTETLPIVTVVSATETPAPLAATATPTLSSNFVPLGTTAANLLGTSAVSSLGSQGAEAPGINQVKIYMIVVDDGGNSGDLVACNDSIIDVSVPIIPTYGVLRASLDKLLAVKTEKFDNTDYYDALYQSSLSIDKLGLASGVASIYLKGDVTLGNECDKARIKAQIEYTARQFSTIKSVDIFINDQKIDDYFSGL